MWQMEDTSLGRRLKTRVKEKLIPKTLINYANKPQWSYKI